MKSAVSITEVEISSTSLKTAIFSIKRMCLKNNLTEIKTMTVARNNSNLWLVANIEVQKEFAEEAFSLFASHTESSRRDTGNISFHTLQNRTAANKFTTVEIWQNQASLEAHQQTEH